MLTANLNLPIGPDMKWKDLREFVELGDGLGMAPEDDVHLDYTEEKGEMNLNGLVIFIDPANIEIRE